MYSLYILKCNNRKSIVDWNNPITIITSMSECPYGKGDVRVKKWFIDEVMKVQLFLDLEPGCYSINFIYNKSNTTAFEVRIKNH